MSLQSKVGTAKIFASAGTILMVLVGVVLIIIAGLGFNTFFFMLTGVVIMIAAVVSFITTSDRLRMETYREAAGPVIFWGVLGLVLAAVFAGLFSTVFIPPPGVIQLLAWLTFIFTIVLGFSFFASSSYIPTEMPTFIPGREPTPSRGPPGPAPPTEFGGPGGPAIATLKVTSGSHTGEVFQLTRTPVVVGRGNVDIKLTDKTISREHAKIDYDGKEFWITDLKSTNGTFVDEIPAPANQPMLLKPGSQVRLASNIYLNFNTPSRTQVESPD